MQKINQLQINFLSLVSATSIFFIIVTLLWICNYGFDFTDESYSLHWISNPFNYTESVTQFGFIYHPIFLLLNGNITLFRQFNFLVTFLLAFILAWRVLDETIRHLTNSDPRLFIVAASLATSSALLAVFAGNWLAIPSYNSLTFQGLLIMSIGLLLATQGLTKQSIFGWVLIGLGGFFVFMGKPTTAAILCFLVPLYLAFAGKFRLNLLLISLSVSMIALVISSYAIDGGIVNFYFRYKGGLETASLFQSKSIFRWDNLALNLFALQSILITAGLTFIGITCLTISNKQFKKISTIISLILVIPCYFFYYNYFPPASAGPLREGLLFFSVPAGFFIAIIFIAKKNILALDRSSIALVFLFIALPYSYAFGTGNDYWVLISSAGFFIVLASQVPLKVISSHAEIVRITLVGSLAVQTMVIIFCYYGITNPYRQSQPLFQNQDLVLIGEGKSKLLLSHDMAGYLSRWDEPLKSADFKKGTPMIDLSGHYAGLIFAIGGKSIGVASSLGGYPGSNKFVTRGLNHVSCEEIIRAWVLTEPLDSNAISTDVLSSFGGDLMSDYVLVGTNSSLYQQKQFLYQPSRSIESATKKCIIARSGSPQ